MHLLTMMDELLRNRQALYRGVREGGSLRALCGRLLMLFLLSTALYGAVMGAFRCFHPSFFFSDFEISAANVAPVDGDVAGMAPENAAIYTRATLPPLTPGMLIRFNRTDPSDAYAVQAIGVEKGYNKIVLAPGVTLSERHSWLQPLLVAVKIPLLFLLTLLICSLALYIINLAMGMQLRFGPTLLLMLFALAVTTVKSRAIGVNTSSSTPEGLAAMQPETEEAPRPAGAVNEVPAPPPASPGFHYQEIPALGTPRPRAFASRVQLVLFSWLLLYCLVGSQLAWTLKPFLGTPYLPATPPFRLEQGNIFVSTVESCQDLK